MQIRDKYLEVPIIQGGMGIGVSLSSLAGNVAKCGGMGVISSVNAGFREETFESNPWETNLLALKKEIEKARTIASGNGLIAVNIMTAVSNYEATCRCAVEAGADAIISGAGLPMKLPEFVKDSKTLGAPIVSSARAASIILRQYKKYDYRPDFFVIEGYKAGGHLGFSKDEILGGNVKENLDILKEVLEVVGDIPVFVAGGVFTGQDMAILLKNGAAGVQMATRFVATHECDADIVFKNTIVNAKKEDIKIIKSPVGMPARALNTPLIQRLEKGEKFLPIKCNGCIVSCPKNDTIPYCISRALIASANGDYENGLFFTGSNADRINEILSVKEVINNIMMEYEACMM